MKRIVVTGATSMIGYALLDECLRHDMKIYAVVRKDSQKRCRLPVHENIIPIECSLEEIDSLPEKIKESCDTFYHIAWGNTGANRNKSVYLQSRNIEYTLLAMKAAAALGCTRFIGAGSQAEYGVLDLDKIGPDAPEYPTTAYGAAKLAAGKLAFLQARELGIDCIWPRIFSVYGIYDKESSMISSGIRKMLKGEETEFTPAGQRWDYLFSADAGYAYYLIGEKGRPGAIYCIGSGQARPLAEYIYTMRDAIDPTIDPGIGRRAYPPGAVMNLCADTTSLVADTGFAPRFGFEEGIRKTVEWQRRSV